MHEIGSEYWDVPLQENVSIQLPDNFRWMLSGRTALDHIINDILAEHGRFTIYMPSYCCDSMRIPFLDHGIEIKFYTVSADASGMSFAFDFQNGCDVVYLLDYFGFASGQVKDIAEKEFYAGKIVIYDAVQSFFSNTILTVPATYYLMSFRKWFFCNAAFAGKNTAFCVPLPNKRNLLYEELRKNAACLKAMYLSGERIDKSVFLDKFQAAERNLDYDYAGYAPNGESVTAAIHCNIEAIRRRRRENASYLIDELLNATGLPIRLIFSSLSETDCPLVLPILVEKTYRDELREFLKMNQIYCPVHWPLTDSHESDIRSNELYDCELSLVCDQRYDIEDMKTEIGVLKAYFHGEARWKS